MFFAFFILMGWLWNKCKEPSRLFDGKDSLIPLGIVVGTLTFGPAVLVGAATLLGGGLAAEGVIGAAKGIIRWRRNRPPKAPQKKYSPPPPAPPPRDIVKEMNEALQRKIAMVRALGLPSDEEPIAIQHVQDEVARKYLNLNP